MKHSRTVGTTRFVAIDPTSGLLQDGGTIDRGRCISPIDERTGNVMLSHRIGACLTPVTVETEALSPLSFIVLDSAIVEIGHGAVGLVFDNKLPRHRVLTGSLRLAD